MSRLMSVAMTTDAVIERRKTVTRRAGWWLNSRGDQILHVGDTLTLCKKVQGRKPGEPIDRLAEVEVVSIEREPLSALVMDLTYGQHEVEREGCPGMDPVDFVDRYFLQAQSMNLDEIVTRIEWRYLDHRIRDGKFVCDASPAARCHTYPLCECEYLDKDLHGDTPAPGHESVQNASCWLHGWLDLTALDDTYYGPHGEDAHGMTFPDGPITYEWDGDDVTWHYADATVPEWAEEDE